MVVISCMLVIMIIVFVFYGLGTQKDCEDLMYNANVVANKMSLIIHLNCRSICNEDVFTYMKTLFSFGLMTMNT